MHQQEKALYIIRHSSVGLRRAGISLSLHYFLFYRIIIVAQVYGSIRIFTLAHFAIAIQAHDLYRVIIESEHLRLREKIPIAAVESLRKIARHFQVLFLVLA